MPPKDTVFTYILTNSTLTITSNMGIRQISMSLLSGSATYCGTKNLNGTASVPIALLDGEFPNFANDYAIDGLTIDAGSGSVKIIANS